jgi:hypothetical protein
MAAQPSSASSLSKGKENPSAAATVVSPSSSEKPVSVPTFVFLDDGSPYTTPRDVGITLRVTGIDLSRVAQLEAHEDNRRQGGPQGRCRRRFLEDQDKDRSNKESLELGLL